MKHALNDLNDYLFGELDKLTNDDLVGEDLTSEVNRAKAVVSIADTLIASYNTELSAARLVAEYGSEQVASEVGQLLLGTHD